MPISQDRMMAIIEAAKSYETAYDTLKESLEEDAKEAMRTGDLDTLLARVLEACNTIKPTMKAAKTVAAESAHFKAVWRRNTRQAEKMRERRGVVAPGQLDPEYQEYLRWNKGLDDKLNYRPEMDQAPRQSMSAEAQVRKALAEMGRPDDGGISHIEGQLPPDGAEIPAQGYKTWSEEYTYVDKKTGEEVTVIREPEVPVDDMMPDFLQEKK